MIQNKKTSTKELLLCFLLKFIIQKYRYIYVINMEFGVVKVDIVMSHRSRKIDVRTSIHPQHKNRC